MHKKTLITLAVLALLSPSPAQAVCASTPGLSTLIPAICWDCLLPIKIGGAEILGSGSVHDTPDLSSSPVCACPSPDPPYVKIGVPVSYWEPARIVETVKDPYCMPALGIPMPNPVPGMLGGGNAVRSASNQVNAGTFAQVHYYIAPLMAMLGIAQSYMCADMETGFDVGYLTEIDPLWNDDAMAGLINPEALLFGNPLAVMSCLPDSLTSQIGLPLDPLFWCMGSFGSAYPLTGHTSNDNYTEANAALAARFIYKMGRELLLSDPAVTMCSSIKTPIWIKSHYRLQILEPVPGGVCIPIGRMSFLWAWFKNLPPGDDNFAWQIFRKRACCASVYQ